jgi:hypothetical protein
VYKALLVDIEAGGGLHVPTFSCKVICNAKPDTYGNAQSKLRRQVQNKVQKLRCMDELQYQRVLNYFGVASGALTRSKRPKRLCDPNVEQSVTNRHLPKISLFLLLPHLACNFLPTVCCILPRDVSPWLSSNVPLPR